MVKRMGRKAAYALLVCLPHLLFFTVISSANAQGCRNPERH